MADRGASHWDQFCEFYYLNQTDTYWPNQAFIIKENCCNDLTLGEMLLSNAAERRFLDFPTCKQKWEQFDPNVAASPLIRMFECGCDLNSCWAQLTKLIVIVKPIDKKTIDNDIVMNHLLDRPRVGLNVLAYIYRDFKKGKLDLNGTKLGNFLKNNEKILHSTLVNLQ